MSYEWSLDPEELFAERYAQMLRNDMPVGDVDRLRASIHRMWVDEPGGWVYEWSQLARHYASQGRHDLAAGAFGWAKFPSLANRAAELALQNQIEQYGLWSRDFPFQFERRVLDVPFRGGRTPVAVHLLSPHGAAADTPILLASGGVDTWKMDVHGIFAPFVQHIGVRVLAFDIPGTGESRIPLSSESREVIAGLASEARRMGARKVGHLGISMGGHFSAWSGLTRTVDAAVVLGGPVGAVPLEKDRAWSFGMSDIVGNALGLDRPTSQEVTARMPDFSLRSLLDQAENAPMLVINGADDVHIPRQDTLVFRGRRDTEVDLLEGTGHCAVTRMSEVVPRMIGWLGQQLR